MATINNIFVFVEDENLSRSTVVPQHPVEKGLPITDNVREEPKTLSISGKIVNTSNLKADAIISKIEALRTGGSLVKYVGRNAAGNYLIKSFNTSHPNTVWGGCEFDMELVEVRIAKSAYTPPKNTAPSAPVLKVGSIVVFKGGNVYVSSDAKKPAVVRERSTCKITIINERSWSLHDYHLISTDGGKVYGWVDVENIEGTGASQATGAVTKGGTKQVAKKSETVKIVEDLPPQFTETDVIKSIISRRDAGGDYANSNYEHFELYFYKAKGGESESNLVNIGKNAGVEEDPYTSSITFVRSVNGTAAFNKREIEHNSGAKSVIYSAIKGKSYIVGWKLPYEA